MDISDLLALVRDSLQLLHSGDVPLSRVLMSAIRIARLSRDNQGLWWLRLEQVSHEDQASRRDIQREAASYFTKEQFAFLDMQFLAAYLDERHVATNTRGTKKEEQQVLPLSVEELENRVRLFDKAAETAIAPEGLAPVDLYFVSQQKDSLRTSYMQAAEQARTILARIRARVHDHLCARESALEYSKASSDIFTGYQNFVDSRLADLAPDAFASLSAAKSRIGFANAEELSQALLSCRRVIKALADALYPARGEPVPSSDGKLHPVGPENYLNRLREYLASASRSTSGAMLTTQLSDLCSRLDAVHSLSCKGTHATVDEYEARQCFIQTYLVVGDIVRVHAANDLAGSDGDVGPA